MLASTYLALFSLIAAPVVLGAGPLDARTKKHHHSKSSSSTDAASTDAASTDSDSATSTRGAICHEANGEWSCTWADDPTATVSTVTVTVTATPTDGGDDGSSSSSDTDSSTSTDTSSNPPPAAGGGESVPTATSSSDGGDDTPTQTSTPCSGSNCYAESKSWIGKDFLADGDDDWEFFSSSDPTHGRVDYVDKDTAASGNLTYTSSDSFIMRADYKNTFPSSGKGRSSVRINTKKRYTSFAAVWDINHMPEGDGTWPALWTVGEDWPNGGELDIVEGVNDAKTNLASLHTSDGCTQPASAKSRLMSGDVGNLNCYAKVDGNKGCGVSDGSTKSFGPNFNSNGGGWYAVERTDSTIKVWFWPRDSSKVPDDVKSNTGNTNPDNWGTPSASFVSDSCDLSKKFGPNQFVINLTLCGDWAGNAFDGGKSACEDHVNNDPSAFKDAYWEFARMSLYEKN